MGTWVDDLAGWARDLKLDPADRAFARQSLVDTVAVTLAAENGPLVGQTRGLPAGLRWATIGHALDYDDVHLPSTSHISVVCAAATLATGGGADEYLAAAGVMARLGIGLGWEHYRRGWHATCTAGAPAAAVAAGLALKLDRSGLASAMSLATASAIGVQGAFGTPVKPLQVGFATQAGIRAAHLVAAGVTADPAAMQQWYELLGGAADPDVSGPPVPGGLAVKLYPCCYASQRPIDVARALAIDPSSDITRIVVATKESAIQPLIHHRPTTGLEGKFSIEYAIVAAVLDGFPDASSFTDAAVNRPRALELVKLVEVVVEPGGEGVLAGRTDISVTVADGSSVHHWLDTPYGHPDRPATPEDLAAKVAGCVGTARANAVLALDWDDAALLLQNTFPGSAKSV